MPVELPERLEVRGARVHNLADVTVRLPHRSLVVFTGLSGSGKSSLAFDTIYAEGQRRHLQSISSFARQLMGELDKPDIDGRRRDLISAQLPLLYVNPAFEQATVERPAYGSGTVTASVCSARRPGSTCRPCGSCCFTPRTP